MPTTASIRMSRTPSYDNPFERAVRTRLFTAGLRYRVHFKLPGMARRTCDLAFPRKRVAIFLDGCFWHGCPLHGTGSKTNTVFWNDKIERNRRRDRDTDEALRAQGWRVLRFWEHQPVDEIVAEIRRVVNEGRPVPPAHAP